VENDVPTPRDEPPVEPEYQLIVPVFEVAPRIMLPELQT